MLKNASIRLHVDGDLFIQGAEENLRLKKTLLRVNMALDDAPIISWEYFFFDSANLSSVHKVQIVCVSASHD